MRVTVLGCGSSTGTPSVESGWGTCDKNNPKNQRLRPSILVEDQDTKILVDTSPDLRQQCLNAEIDHLDAVLFTHDHADHTHGIDDLRAINRRMNAAIPCYGDAVTLKSLQARFGYVFEPLAAGAEVYYKPTLNAHKVAHGDHFSVNNTQISTWTQDHGYCNSLGFRFGDFAFSTDLVAMSDEAFVMLDGVGTWMLGVFQQNPHPTHCDVGRALEWIDRVKPKRTVLTHLGNKLDFAELTAQLPDGVQVAYDGLFLDI